MKMESTINLKSFLGYSVLLGVIVAAVIMLGNLSSVSERHEKLIIQKINDTEEVAQVIGEYKSLWVKKFTNYSGTNEDQPYFKFLLKVTGDKDSAYVRVMIMSPDTDMESITVSLYD